MSFLSEKSQLKKGLRVADGPVEAVAPPPEFDFIIALNNGRFVREPMETTTIDTRPDYIQVNGPDRGEFVRYPMTSIAWYGQQLRGNGKDAA